MPPLRFTNREKQFMEEVLNHSAQKRVVVNLNDCIQCGADQFMLTVKLKVTCRKCGACTLDYRSNEEAIEAWNKCNDPEMRKSVLMSQVIAGKLYDNRIGQSCWYFMMPSAKLRSPWKKGFLRMWGSDFIEFESGPGIYPIAIVEDDETGKCYSIPVEQIQFSATMPDPVA